MSQNIEILETSKQSKAKNQLSEKDPLQKTYATKYDIIAEIESHNRIWLPTLIATLTWSILIILPTLLTAGELLLKKLSFAFLVIYLPFIFFYTISSLVLRAKFGKFSRKTKSYYPLLCISVLMVIFAVIGGVIWGVQFYTSYHPYFTNLEKLDIKKVNNCEFVKEFSNEKLEWRNLEQYSVLQYSFKWEEGKHNTNKDADASNSSLKGLGYACTSSKNEKSILAGDSSGIKYLTEGDTLECHKDDDFCQQKHGDIPRFYMQDFDIKFPSWHCFSNSVSRNEPLLKKPLSPCYVGVHKYSIDGQSKEIVQILADFPPKYYDESMFLGMFAFCFMPLVLLLPTGCVLFRYYRKIISKLNEHFSSEHNFDKTIDEAMKEEYQRQVSQQIEKQRQQSIVVINKQLAADDELNTSLEEIERQIKIRELDSQNKMMQETGIKSSSTSF